MKKLLSLTILLLLISVVFYNCNDADNNNDDDEDIRTVFLGQWSVNESCSKRVYTVNITLDPANTARVLIENFADPGAGVGGPAYGFVTTNRITLDPSYTVGDDWTVSGSGVLTGSDQMDWNYSLLISGNEQSCSAVYTKQK